MSKCPLKACYFENKSTQEAVGLLLFRLVVGSALMLHGWPKFQSAFNWMGPDAPVPGILQAAAALSEFGGGIAVILGLLTPLATLGIFCTMAVALGMVHLPAGHPFVSAKGPGPSFEVALVYLVSALLLMLNGPGRFSLDYMCYKSKLCKSEDSPPAA